MKMNCVLPYRKEEKNNNTYSLYGKMPYKNGFEFPKIHSRGARHSTIVISETSY